MRKSLDIQERNCIVCGNTYKPTGNTQCYCKECSAKKMQESKRRYSRKNHAERKKCKEPCCVCGGEFSGHFDEKPYCNKHFLRMKKHGTVELVARAPTTKAIDNGDSSSTITTTNGVKITVSTTDVQRLSNYSWCVSKAGYAVARIDGKVVRMNRFLLNATTADVVVDHINGNRLDNRRENLRICAAADNAKNMKTKNTNTSGKTGVYQLPNGGYRARITVSGKEKNLGHFQTYEEAAEARNKAEICYFGEFRRKTNGGPQNE